MNCDHTTSYEILRLIQEEMLVRFPAFPEAFGQLNFVPCSELDKVFGTDGLQLFFHPDLLKQLFLTDPVLLKYSFLHTHLHCLCLHVIQTRPVAAALWDEECDRFAAELAQKLWPKLHISECAPDSHRFWFRGCAADPRTIGSDMNCSSRKGSSRLSSDQLTHLESLQERWQNRLPQILSSVQSGQRQGQKGTSVEEADLKQRDERDYRKFLRQFCIPGEEALLDMDSFDYIPYHYGLEYYKNMPFIEPLEYQEVNRLDELAIAIDTSGSCSGRIVRRFLEETWNILRQRENFFAKMRLHLIQCDCMVQEHRIITSVEEWEAAVPDLQIRGHGDTDFCPVFDYLEKLIQKKEIRHLRGLLYFTDGDGIFPGRPPLWDTAFVFLNNQTEKHEIPKWAIRLNLHLPDEF